LAAGHWPNGARQAFLQKEQKLSMAATVVASMTESGFEDSESSVSCTTCATMLRGIT
jgi:hypothetical protein